MNEILDIVDEYGNPTGETADRETVHRKGLLHRTAHVWLVRWTERRGLELLLQKRSRSKDSFPGCWDVSSAGHIPAGEEWIPSALRELREELGVVAKPRDLHFVGKRMIETNETFHGRPFRNRQISAVYFLLCNDPGRSFKLQTSEISEVRWMPVNNGGILDKLNRPSFPNCISRMEVEWVAQHPAAEVKGRLGAVRFSVKYGPESLFERVGLVVRPEDYFDRAYRFRHKRDEKIIRNPDSFLDGISSKPENWHLVGCDVAQGTGRFVRSHWNVRVGAKWYRLVLDYRGNVHALKPIDSPTGEQTLRHSLIGGSAYELVDRVNRALMEAACGITDRWMAIRRGKTIVP